uniref:Uncharacterized protein n=1 Tax=viral metagenome TaxID=1070528 RepID=A0A6H1ZS11_9ZZZZ
MAERSRIDDDRRILEAATEGPWSVSADQCGNGWVRELETNDDGGIPIEDAICIANARNRMHLYLVLARAVRDAIDVPFNSPEWHAKARAITVALADIEAPDEPKEADNAPE